MKPPVLSSVAGDTNNDAARHHPLPDWQTASLKGKRVVVRVDCNMPANDNTRLRMHAPTIRALLEQGAASVTVAGHYGRPAGQRIPALSLAPIAVQLSEILDCAVEFQPCALAPSASRIHNAPAPVRVLENLRFHPGEEGNHPDFAQQLAAWGDVMIIDSFSTAHRRHASTVGVMSWIPCLAGPVLQQEWRALQHVLSRAQQPSLAIIGGSKIDTKLALIRVLLTRMDAVFLAGSLAFPVLAGRQQYEQGPEHQHKHNNDIANLGLTAHTVALGREIWEMSQQPGHAQLLLPKDLIWADCLHNPSAVKSVSTENPKFFAHPHTADAQSLTIAPDIGPETVALLADAAQSAALILWNGPLGVFEHPPFDNGTTAAAKIMEKATRNGTTVIAGGGDTLAALLHARVRGSMSYESLSGGAFLEFIEKDGYLPGLFLPLSSPSLSSSL